MAWAIRCALGWLVRGHALRSGPIWTDDPARAATYASHAAAMSATPRLRGAGAWRVVEVGGEVVERGAEAMSDESREAESETSGGVAMVPIEVEGWPGWRLWRGEARSWIKDLDLAAKVELESQHDIRRTIAEAIKDGAIGILGGAQNTNSAENGLPEVRLVEELAPIGDRGAHRLVKVYYLSEVAAIIVLSRLRTPKARSLTRMVAEVFVAFARGEIGLPAAKVEAMIAARVSEAMAEQARALSAVILSGREYAESILAEYGTNASKALEARFYTERQDVLALAEQGMRAIAVPLYEKAIRYTRDRVDGAIGVGETVRRAGCDGEPVGAIYGEALRARLRMVAWLGVGASDPDRTRIVRRRRSTLETQMRGIIGYPASKGASLDHVTARQYAACCRYLDEELAKCAPPGGWAQDLLPFDMPPFRKLTHGSGEGGAPACAEAAE